MEELKTRMLNQFNEQLNDYEASLRALHAQGHGNVQIDHAVLTAMYLLGATIPMMIDGLDQFKPNGQWGEDPYTYIHKTIKRFSKRIGLTLDVSK